MNRISSQFDEWPAACAAVDALVARSFPVEDVRLHALRPDGTSPQVPIRTRSHLAEGSVIGAVVGALLGVILSIVFAVEGPILFGALGGGSVGGVAGGAIGLGAWSIRPDQRRVPADARSYVVAVVVPDGRVEEAGSILTAVGGRDAGPRLVSTENRNPT